MVSVDSKSYSLLKNLVDKGCTRDQCTLKIIE